jgi:hypothetical protein
MTVDRMTSKSMAFGCRDSSVGLQQRLKTPVRFIVSPFKRSLSYCKLVNSTSNRDA